MMDLPVVSADMLERVERYTRFVISAERLADFGFAEDGEIDDANRGDLVDLAEGDVIIAPRNGRRSYGLVDAVADGTVTWVFLTPSALDREQQRWGRRGRLVADPDYPIRMVREHAALMTRTDSVSRQIELTDRLEHVLREHAVATRCTRRRWAAAVPLSRKTVGRDRVWLCVDHELSVRVAQ